MRICFVSTELAGVRGGGIGTYVAEAGLALSAAGHQVWLITPDPGDDARRAKLERQPGFHRVLRIDPAEPGAPPPFTPADPARDHAQRVLHQLGRCGVAFDYIEFPDYLAEGFAALRARRLQRACGDAVLAVMLHSPTHDILDWNRQLHLADTDSRACSVLEDGAIRNAPVLLAPSTRLLEMTRGRLGLPEGHGRVIRYPMTLGAAPEPPPARERLAELSFLYVGRIEPRKGVDRLIDAFRRLPDLSLDLVGRDEAYSPVATSFRQWISDDLPGNVRFVDALPRERLLQRLREVDVVILPSPWENWPNACIEAMAEARVVIGGRHGGMGEMIEHGVSGFTVDGSSADDIVRVIEEDLGAALPRLPEIGRAAAARIRELSDPARYVAEIESVVEGARAAAIEPSPATLRLTLAIELRDENEAALAAAVDHALAEDGGRHQVIVVDASPTRGRAAGWLAGRSDPRLSVVDAERNRRCHPRDATIDAADGEAIVFLRAGDRLRPQAAATLARILAEHPEVDGVGPVAAAGDALLTSTPFDPALALVRGAVPDVPPVLRTAVLRRPDLRFDPTLDLYADRGLMMDAVRLGLRIEHFPEPLLDLGATPAEPQPTGDWQRHRALLALLARDHLPPLEPDQQRALTALLLRTFGSAAFASPLGELAHRTDAAVGGRMPRLARFLRRVAARLLRAHGRRKDRRAGRG